VAFVVCFLGLSIGYGTRYWYRSVHADAPALGLGLLACASLLDLGGRSSQRVLILASLLTALAIFTKQTTIGIPLGVAAWLWIARGGRPAVQYSLGVLACCIVLGLLSLAVFSPAALYFNMIRIPSRHPWEEPGLKGLLWALSEGTGPALVPALILVPAAVLLVRKIVPDRRRLRPECNSAAWTLFLLVAIFMIPTSLLGRVKVGGQSNSFHFLIFLYAAASLSFLQTASALESGPSRAFVRSVLLAAAAPILVWAGWTLAHPDGPKAPLEINPYRTADAFYRQHPGQVHFPFNPLCTLLHDSRLYHFEYGVYDRALAGFPPSEAHLRAHLPQNLKYLAYCGTSRTILNELPEFRSGRILYDPSLVGFTIYEASPAEDGR
jgi:hypothetical protein